MRLSLLRTGIYVDWLPAPASCISDVVNLLACGIWNTPQCSHAANMQITALRRRSLMEQVRIADILSRKYKQHRAKCRLNAQESQGLCPWLARLRKRSDGEDARPLVSLNVARRIMS